MLSTEENAKDRILYSDVIFLNLSPITCAGLLVLSSGYSKEENCEDWRACLVIVANIEQIVN